MLDDRESSMLQSGQTGSVRSLRQGTWPTQCGSLRIRHDPCLHQMHLRIEFAAPGREQIVQRALFSQFLLSVDQLKMPQVQT